MLTISKSKLKSQMLQIFREIEKSGEGVIVTDYNRPVIQILPISQKCTVEEAFGHLQGQIIYHEDINTPTTEEWDDLVI